MKTEGSKKLGGELLVYSTDNTKQAARDAKLPNQLHCPIANAWPWNCFLLICSSMLYFSSRGQIDFWARNGMLAYWLILSWSFREIAELGKIAAS